MKKHYAICFVATAFALHQGVAQTAVWDTLPIAFNAIPKFMYEDSVTDRLYIGGGFWEVNQDSTNYLISFDGQNYQETAVDNAGNPILIPQTPQMVIRYDSALIVGGFGGLISYENTAWNWLDHHSVIWAAMPYQEKMVFGGRFPAIGLTRDSLDAVAVWDGQKWGDFLGIKQFIGGNNNAVTDIIEYQGQIYVGGNFTEPGGLNEIIRWDGQQWRDVAGGIPNSSGLGGINDMIIYKGDLYVGGIFTKAGGAPGNNIARWNGTAWDDVGGGVGIKNEGANSVEQMVVYNDNLWVTGSFLYAGGVPAKFIARWDGEKWYGLGDATSFTHVLGVYHDTLYTTTGIKYPDGKTRAHLIKLLQPDYYDTASAPVSTPVHRPLESALDIGIALLPGREQLRIDFSDRGLRPGQAIIELVDPTGRLVRTEVCSTTQLQHHIPVGHLATGLYVVIVKTEQGQARKLIWR